MEKEPSTQFHGIFDHFSPTYEIRKFLMIKLCIGVSDVIHANERTLTLNYSLHVNFHANERTLTLNYSLHVNFQNF